MQIYDGRTTNDTLLGAFTGTKRPFVVLSSGRFTLVKLLKQDKLLSLCNFKGVYTFGTTKGKVCVIYRININGSEQLVLKSRELLSGRNVTGVIRNIVFNFAHLMLFWNLS